VVVVVNHHSCLASLRASAACCHCRAAVAACPAARAAVFASATGRTQSFMTRLYAVLYTRFECTARSAAESFMTRSQATATPLGGEGGQAGLLRACFEVGSGGGATASPPGAEGEAGQTGLLRGRPFAAAAFAAAGFLETSAAAGLCLS
jgi:hypothetical protein